MTIIENKKIKKHQQCAAVCFASVHTRLWRTRPLQWKHYMTESNNITLTDWKWNVGQAEKSKSFSIIWEVMITESSQPNVQLQGEWFAQCKKHCLELTVEALQTSCAVAPCCTALPDYYAVQPVYMYNNYPFISSRTHTQPLINVLNIIIS